MGGGKSATLRDRIRWWVYGVCLAYCVHMIHPQADPTDFCLLDMRGFISISKDEVQEIIEEAPDVAWHFESLLEEYKVKV